MLPLVAVFFALLAVSASGLIALSNAATRRAQSQTAADAAALAGAAAGQGEAATVAGANRAVLTAFELSVTGVDQRRVEVVVEVSGIVAKAAAERSPALTTNTREASLAILSSG